MPIFLFYIKEEEEKKENLSYNTLDFFLRQTPAAFSVAV